MFKKINKLYPGFTLLEMGAVVVVISIIGIGIIMTSQTTMGAYQMDVIRQDIRHYGNTVVREISERIRTAEKVEFSSLLGFAKIDLWEDASQSTPSHIIQANEEEGILINNDPLLDGTLRFPSEGESRENNQFLVKLENFTSYQETEPPNRPSLSKVKRSIRYIDLVLSMDPKVNPNMNVEKEEFHFKRNIFIANAYLAEVN
jgi:hypothetical protein|tara:strand:+ start:269 stop:874 length:606 start_codon:yes stop_codon:yes gene_type:complete